MLDRKINLTFSSLEGGGGVGGPLENFENQVSRRSYLWSFCRGNLPSVNEEIERKLLLLILTYIVCNFKYKI